MRFLFQIAYRGFRVWGFFAWISPLPSGCRDPSLPWGQIRDPSFLGRAIARVTSASLVKVSLQVRTRLVLTPKMRYFYSTFLPNYARNNCYF